MLGHLTQNDIKRLIQRLSFAYDLTKSFKDLLLLPEYPRLVEVSEQDGKEQVQHDDVATNDERDEVEGADRTHASHRFIHNIVPALAHQDLENGDDRPYELVKVSPWSFSLESNSVFIDWEDDRLRITTRLLHRAEAIYIKLDPASEETHAKKCEDVDEEHQEDNIISNGGERKGNGVYKDLEISTSEQLEDLEKPEASQARHETWAIILVSGGVGVDLYLQERNDNDKEVEPVVVILHEDLSTHTNHLQNDLDGEDGGEHIVED